ncbi:MAG: response regulator [Oscillospiraceae bacterium]|nr:response regulator [Oscillospiraceae bacterium]
MVKKRIIVVDDSQTMLEASKQMLKDVYEVYPAQSAERMFAILEHVVPSLILLDVNMPEMSGFEAMRRLRAKPAWKNIPVVFLTAMDDAKSEMEGLSLGALDYIHKPFNSVLLLRRIETHLSLLETQAESIRALKAKGDFLLGMSHEIRTPMNSIIGYSELALGDDPPPKMREYINHIYNNAKWMLQIISDVLDVSKIESGNLVLDSVPFDLGEIFAHSRLMYLTQANDKNVILDFRSWMPAGKMLVGDPVHLRQSLVNLLSNAVKFTRDGVVRMDAEPLMETEDECVVRFEVRDTGPGITQEQMEKLYEPFRQFGSQVARTHGGTGLGLTITKSLVELMGGVLEVESEPGSGSKFTFSLEFSTVPADQVLSSEVTGAPAMARPTFSGEVLVCEDDAMSRRIICEHLSRVGLTSVAAFDGAAGVEFVRQRLESGAKPFDLILMDIYMPEVDGLEAASIISGMATGTPIVALSASIMVGDMDLYKSSGMADCMGKPFTSQDLWKCLMRHLRPVAVPAPVPLPSGQALIKELEDMFLEENRDKAGAVTRALAEGDTRLAFRIVHTLKGTAGQIGRHMLRAAAAAAEKMIREGEEIDPAIIETVEEELQAVLKEITERGK